MGKTTNYSSRSPDASGIVHYTDDEHAVWHTLYTRQRQAIRGRATQAFIDGLDLLQLRDDTIPQLKDVSAILERETGWAVEPVPALIPFSRFFELLANRRFPAATFIRSRDELDYLQEPDIFHEIFGHTPLLTNPFFADFTHRYGEIGLAASKEERVFLARMYWFTAEFGLIQPPGEAMRIYGGGILSSIGETEYAVESPTPQRRRFAILDALRTPYRIDIMQPLYYVIEDFRELAELTASDLMAKVHDAQRLGLYPPAYPPKTPEAANH